MEKQLNKFAFKHSLEFASNRIPSIMKIKRYKLNMKKNIRANEREK